MCQFYKPIRIKYLRIILSILLTIFCIWLLSPIKNNVDYTDNKYYIAHAGGAIDGYRYTNSKEALIQSINKQYQYIELDLTPNSDSVLLCLHDIITFNRMTGYGDSEKFPMDFKTRKIYQKYTPITLDEVLEIRQGHPFTLVTDKTDDPIILNKYFAYEKERLLVEAFSWQRYADLKRHGYIPIMALYHKNILHYIYYCLMSKSHIEWITTSGYRYTDILKFRILKRLFGVKIAFVPLINEVDYYKDNIGNEFDLIYSDSLVSH